MARSGFLTAGTWVVDRNITVDHWPGEDMLATVSDVAPAGGGPGCNFAVAMRRLDPSLPVATQGLIGQDSWGDLLIDVADAHGIDRTGLYRTNKAQTQVTDAYLSTASGRRTHVLFPGTGPLLTPDHFDLGASDCRFFHTGLPGIHPQMDSAWRGDANGWVTVLKAAQAAGMRTNLELVTAAPEVIRRLVIPCLAHLDTLVVNDSEIGALAQVDTVPNDSTDLNACCDAAHKVLAKGAMAFVVVHAPAAAVLVSRDNAPIIVPSIAIPDRAKVGPNGAGDAFAAGFFLGMHRDAHPETCLRLAHASAAASLRAADTYSGINDAQFCLELAHRWGWRDTPVL